MGGRGRPCSLIGSDTSVRESEPIREHSLPRPPKFRTRSHTASHILSCDLGYWFHSYNLDQMCHKSLISCCGFGGNWRSPDAGGGGVMSTSILLSDWLSGFKAGGVPKSGAKEQCSDRLPFDCLRGSYGLGMAPRHHSCLCIRRGAEERRCCTFLQLSIAWAHLITQTC